jgi:hypothetical protein
MKKALSAMTFIALAGCSATYTDPDLPPDHPANAQADEAPPPERSATLDLAAADPLTPAVGAQQAGHQAHATEVAPAELAGGVAAPYSCPMHPEVTSSKPDQRCPKCGMRLQKQDGGNQP